jgi:hypothetical protein
MNLICPRRTPDKPNWLRREPGRDRGRPPARSALGCLLALLSLALMGADPTALGLARAEEGGIEIGADPNTPPPPRTPAPPRADSARRGSTPVVPVPPQPGVIDAELERARERMAHEQERLEEERARVEEEMDRSHVDRDRQIHRRDKERGQRGEIVRMGQDVVIEPGDIVTDVVVIGGDLEVLGEVDGDAVSVGGDFKVGPGARISGDAVAVGGDLDVSPEAIVEGDEVEVGTGVGFLHGLSGLRHDEPRHSSVGRSILTLLVFLFIGWLAAVLAGERLNSLADALSQDWLRSFLTGMLVLVLWLPAVFLSAITVIGIPVAIFLILAVPMLAFVGYLIGALALGRRISVGLGRPLSSPLRNMVAGILVIGLLAFIGEVLGLVGFLGPFGIAFKIVSYVLFSFAATSGLGVIALAIFASRFRHRPPLVVPPPPPAPPAPPAPPTAEPPSPPPAGEPTQAPA